jgi:hypothetical protein
MAQVNSAANLSDARVNGVAPFDAVDRPNWPAWKIALAYAVMFAVAVGSIWLIDGHVLLATESKDRPTAPVR